MIKNSNQNNIINIQKEYDLIDAEAKKFIDNFYNETIYLIVEVVDLDNQNLDPYYLGAFINLSEIQKKEFLSIINKIKNLYEKIEDIFPFVDINIKLSINEIIKIFQNPQMLKNFFIERNLTHIEKINWFINFKEAFVFFQDKFIELMSNLMAIVYSSAGFESTPSHNLTIDGVDVIVNNFRYLKNVRSPSQRAPQSEYDLKVKDILEKVRLGIDKIKRSGFGNALKDFKIVISEDSSIPGAGGHFTTTPVSKDQFSHKINIFLTSSFPADVVLCHEFSHKFYFLNLESNARKAWSELISKGKIKTSHLSNFINLIDINTLLPEEVINRGINPKPKEFESLLNRFKRESLININDYCQNNNVSNLDKKIYQVMLDEIYDFIKSNFNPENQNINLLPRLIDNFFEFSASNPKYITEEGLTEYARTNPEEAFAEALMMYIYYGSNAVPPATRNFLVNLSRLGGANPKYSEKLKLNNILKISNIFYNLSRTKKSNA